MKKHRIAVVVPVYNAELYVCDALDSVVAQSRPPDQLIIIDDGSSDGSLKNIRTWASQYRREIHVLQQNNHGVAAARNRGIRHTEAQLIAFLDADDLFLPDHLQLLEGAYANHPDLAVAFGDASYFDANGVREASSLRGTRIEGLKWKEQENGLRLIEGSPYVSLVRGNYISLSASMISKDTLEGVGCFDETLQSAEDRDVFLRL